MKNLLVVLLLASMLPHAEAFHSLPSFTKAFQQVISQSREGTHFIGLQHSPPLSRQISQLRNQGFELSTGAPVSFNDWYSTSWQDLYLTWMTQINPQLGFIWGVGTGERGQKYTISPSLQLGFEFQQPVGKNSSLTFRASTRVGGRLREKACMATYNLFGYSEPQQVNCRLAATHLAPEDTLQFLFNDPPIDRMQLNARYLWTF